MMGRLCRFLLWGFGLAYVLALLLFLVGTFGWFGSETGPLAGVFLIPLGLPWNQLIDWAPDGLRPVLAAAAPLLNLAVLKALCARLSPSSGR
jgi:hypothetical protein